MVLYAFGVLGFAESPGLHHLADVVTDDFNRSVVLNTIRLALTVTVATFVVGYPMAWVIGVSSGFKRTLLLALVIAPLLTNPVVRTVGWMVILSPRGIVNTTLGTVGIGPLNLFGNITGVTIALVHVFLPFMILPMLNTIESIPQSVRESGVVHGGHPIVVFFRVLFPMSIRGIVAGSTLVFLLTTGSLVTPSLIGAKRVWVLSTLIYQKTGLGDWGEAGALAVWLFAVGLVMVAVFNRLGERVVGARERGKKGPLRKALTSTRVVLARWLRVLPQWKRLGSAIRTVYVTLFVGYMLFPLAMVVKAAFDSSRSLHAGFDGFTLEHFQSAFDSTKWIQSFLISSRMALIAVFLGFLLAIPASYAIVRGTFRGRDALMSFLLSPLAVPRLVLGLGFLLFFNMLDIGPSVLRLALTHVLIVLPFITRTMVTAIYDIDASLEEAARTLGRDTPSGRPEDHAPSDKARHSGSVDFRLPGFIRRVDVDASSRWNPSYPALSSDVQ